MTITKKKARRLYVALSVLVVLGWALIAYAGSGQDLIIAAIEGNTSKVKTLLANGAEVNAKANNGWTPLMLASEKGHSEIVKILKKAGAKE